MGESTATWMQSPTAAMLMNEVRRRSTAALPIHTSTYPQSPLPHHPFILYPVLMTFIMLINCTERKGRMRRKHYFLSCLPFLPLYLPIPPFPSSAVPTFICCHSYHGAVHFPALVWFAARPVTHPPSSRYDWAPFLLGRATHPPRAELRLNSPSCLS